MIKWGHYAEFMLRRVAEDPDALDRPELTQAILQHYGWRSFYLDLSASPAVSSFFAGFKWTSRPAGQLIEDCFEDPVFVRRMLATYEPSHGEGHLYVISEAELASEKIGVHDLSQLRLGPGGLTRYAAQQAWLAGPLQTDLPLRCIVARIAGPAEVFRAFAQQSGISEVKTIFPESRFDLVLHLLLSLPWIEIPGSREVKPVGIKFFARALELPEYHDDDLAKHQPPATAFYCGAKLSDIVKDPALTIRSAPAPIIFGTYSGEPVFPRVTALVRQRKRVLFEVDELVWLPETIDGATWGKGLWVEERPDGLIQVGDLIVDHPGQKLAGFGALAMWSYAVDEQGRWTHTPMEGDCPCGHAWRHKQHLSAVGILEYELSRRRGLVRRSSG
jgi:hypothetical protein